MTGRRPSLPLPEPLRGLEIGTFTYHSIVDRLPDIGRRMLAENTFSNPVMSKVEALLDGIPEDPIRHLSDSAAPDAADWFNCIEPYKGQDWLQVPWFFAETYFYRRIIEATGYFGEGGGRGIDPFAHQKREGLATSQEAIKSLSERVESMIAKGRLDRQMAANLLRTGLWSNQADLSLWPVGSESDPAHDDEEQKRSHILVDESEKAAEYIFSKAYPLDRLDFLIDNAGFELVVDLALAVIFLGLEVARTVHLHLKIHPTFVSDATMVDVLRTVNALKAMENSAMASTGERLQEQIDGGRMKLQEHNFWTSPLAMWDMPSTLRQELAQSSFIISKGDANYRRLLGDRHWSFTMPFEDIVSYMPAPIVALRALKSEVASGLSPGQPESTARQDPHWPINGRWGVIQFSKPSAE